MMIVLLASGMFIYIKRRDNHLRKFEALKKEKIEFQFETLKNQVNPHFLFNSFNTLISIIETDKKIAVEYVERLSAFFRSILNYRDKDLISLEEELALASDYFFLQQKRFGASLMMNVHIQNHLLYHRVPPLALQLLLENAIKHNAVSKETPLLITIATENNMLLVKNNLNPKRNLEASTGTGLSNIANRYKLLSNEEVRLEKTLTEFIVSLPLIKPD